jgi:hypothetical protein
VCKSLILRGELTPRSASSTALCLAIHTVVGADSSHLQSAAELGEAVQNDARLPTTSKGDHEKPTLFEKHLLAQDIQMVPVAHDSLCDARSFEQEMNL